MHQLDWIWLLTTRQIDAMRDMSACLDRHHPEDAAAAYCADSCERCSRQSYGSCYECQCIDLAIQEATGE